MVIGILDMIENLPTSVYVNFIFKNIKMRAKITFIVNRSLTWVCMYLQTTEGPCLLLFHLTQEP